MSLQNGNAVEFKEPDDVNVPIARYMSFTKYVALLSTSSLYFSTVARVNDPYEGALTTEEIRKRNLLFSTPGWKSLGAAPERVPALFESLRNWTYINCWHANGVESAAMWKEYAGSTEAVAIQSTFQQLKIQLPGDKGFKIGLVRYIDDTLCLLRRRT